MYIYIIQEYRARPSMPSHRHTHVFLYPHTRACTRVWLQTNADGAADARVRILGIRTRLEAQASIQTHVVRMAIPHPRARARARTRSRRHGFYICTHTYTYVLTHTQIYVHNSWSRACTPLPTRAHTHIRTHTWTLDMHAYICI